MVGDTKTGIEDKTLDAVEMTVTASPDENFFHQDGELVICWVEMKHGPVVLRIFGEDNDCRKISGDGSEEGGLGVPFVLGGDYPYFGLRVTFLNQGGLLG